MPALARVLVVRVHCSSRVVLCPRVGRGASGGPQGIGAARPGRKSEPGGKCGPFGSVWILTAVKLEQGEGMKRKVHTLKRRTDSAVVRTVGASALLIPLAAFIGGVKLNNHNETVVR